MRLSCQKVSLLILASAIACSEPAGPRTVSAQFELQAINGRPLPTYLAPTPGPTATILSSTLVLEKTGKGVMTEHRDDMFQGETTSTYTFDYRINGFQNRNRTFRRLSDQLELPGCPKRHDFQWPTGPRDKP
jgi:hypothetical protein